MQVNRLLLALLIALTGQLIFHGIITYECHPVYDYLPEFCAAPFVYSTDYHWGSSMSATLFIKGLLANILVIGGVVYGLLTLSDFLPSDYLRRAISKVGYMVAGACLLTKLVHVTVFNLSVQWDHESFFMAEWAEPAPCEWRFSSFRLW